MPGWMDDLHLDLRHTIRTTFTTASFLVAVISLGVAVGATGAVYWTAEWLLDRSPTGVVEPERLVSLKLTERARADEIAYGFSYPQFTALSEVQDAFVDIASYAKVARFVATDEWAAEAVHEFVSGSYFTLLGVEPAIGRLIGTVDDVDGAPVTAVISHDFWRSHFGGSPDVIGRPIRLGTAVGTVIGVLPADYVGYAIDWNGPTHIWLPTRAARAIPGMAGMLTMTQSFFQVVGRLRPGVSQLQAEEMAQRWVPSMPTVTTTMFEADAISLRPAREARISRREAATTFLRPLLLVCGLVLLAALANTANYVLGRAGGRRREMAVRAALGARRSRVLRQVVSEAAAMGSAVGVLAWISAAVVTRLLGPLPETYLDLPGRVAPPSTTEALDPGMAVATAVVAFTLSLVLGLIPAWRTFHDPLKAIRGVSASWSWARVRPSARQGILALQVALGFVLLATAASFARSFTNVAATDTEFTEPESLLIARLVPVTMPASDVPEFYAAVLKQLQDAPGVVSVTFAHNFPFAGGQNTVRRTHADVPVEVGSAVAGPAFFETSGIRLVAGTEFDEAGPDQGEVIINRTLSHRFWPGESALGKTLVVGETDRIVRGVVDKARCRTFLGEPTGCVWQPLTRAAATRVFRVRTDDEAMTMAPVLREIVDGLSSGVAVVQMQSMRTFLRRFSRAERVAAIMSASLALFGMVLVVIGFVSVFRALVRETARECAIRAALGASIVRLSARIAGQASLIVLLGVMLGGPVAFRVATMLQRRLVGVAATDTTSYAVATGLTVLTVLGTLGLATRSLAREEPIRHLHADI